MRLIQVLFSHSDPAGESDFTIFMTDYETYAGIFTCQKLAFAHRQSATLLSRSKDLDKLYVDKVSVNIKSKISSQKIYLKAEADAIFLLTEFSFLFELDAHPPWFIQC